MVLVMNLEDTYLAPISAQPRAASMPIPFGPEAPVTMTVLPFMLNNSKRESGLGTEIILNGGIGCVRGGFVVEELNHCDFR